MTACTGLLSTVLSTSNSRIFFPFTGERGAKGQPKGTAGPLSGKRGSGRLIRLLLSRRQLARSKFGIWPKIAPPRPVIPKICADLDGREAAGLLQQLCHEGKTLEHGKLAEEIGQRLAAAEAKLMVANTTISRLEIQIQGAARAPKSTRRVPTSPNSKFMSYRASTRAQSIIRSSPPSPITTENNGLQVNYQAPTFLDDREGN
jgi:hypothetical protein